MVAPKNDNGRVKLWKSHVLMGIILGRSVAGVFMVVVELV